MAQLVQLDKEISFLDQLKVDVGPIVLINVFQVPEGKAEATLAAWTEDADYMKRQPGFISTQLHRGIGGSNMFINHAVWESSAALRDAFMDEEFQRLRGAYPEGVTASPHVFQTVEVPGICLGEMKPLG
ncbi:antibiotic biosynthesis monooxygenase [Pseudomaricurvus alkylphenolicus]|uniref:antibiotic biosynthesis monooxygenase family protein n=1 Tax=Pseudomaricurvus alkylphenolicus TaxID=1306991 RepID=UPI00141DD751|nr:antibiotic biosynthesis monooxygenase family protein [Pseudomaricurvus alkylphenolicus]NIB38370.1 antibiotic biosynthesis monooxygenase [Pseudomaricurvus alkylphenolicus]